MFYVIRLKLKKAAILISLFIISCFNSENIEDIPYLFRYDFDGDGIRDKIKYTFSGGAHCCYKISIFLSTSNVYYSFPFTIDGGYMFGLDDSQPERFHIKDFDFDGLPEIYIKINTYNNEYCDIPIEWQEKYNIKANFVIIDYDNDKLIVRDYNRK